MQTLNEPMGLIESPAQPKGAGSRGGKSNTERSRLYRLSKKKIGGAELSVFVSPQAESALQIIRAHGNLTKTAALEEALIKRATEVAADAASIERLRSKGLSAEDAQVWLDRLEEIQH
jgi:hypothetical protein